MGVIPEEEINLAIVEIDNINSRNLDQYAA